MVDMKRKITLLAMLALVAALALAALAGCADSGKQKAIDAYKQASEATAQAKSADYDMNFDFSASYSGMSITGNGTSRLQYVLPDNLADLDKAQVAFDLDMSLNAMVEKMSFDFGTYLKDGNVYFTMSLDQPTATEVKGYFSVPDVIEGVAKEILGTSSGLNLDEILNSIDLDTLLKNLDFEKLLAGSGTQPNIDKYVLSGSFDGTTITLDIDLASLIKDSLATSLSQSGMGMDSMLQTVTQFEQMITGATATITATVDDAMMFTSMNTLVTMELDVSKAYGTGATTTMGASTMTITANSSCPSIKTNTVKSVEYPSLKGYEDVTEQTTDLIVEVWGYVLNQAMGGSSSYNYDSGNDNQLDKLFDNATDVLS